MRSAALSEGAALGPLSAPAPIGVPGQSPQSPQPAAVRVRRLPTVAPFVGRMLRRLGVDANYRRNASRQWQIEPPCQTVRGPTLFDEADIAYVTGVPAHTDLAYQMSRIAPGPVVHPARHAHELRDVVMAGGHLFTWRMVQALAARSLPRASLAPRREFENAALASTEFGNRFFGHWLCDDMPLATTAQQWAEPIGHIGADNRPSPHQIDYQALLEPGVRLLEDAFFRRLTVFEAAPETAAQTKRYALLRERLRAGRLPRDNAGVMLLRRASGQRRVLVNEDEIAAMAQRRGLTVIDPMVRSVAEIVEACLDARVVLGTEGSHLAHALIPMARGGAMLVLQPPFKLDHFWKERCDAIDAVYAFAVGRARGGLEFDVHVDRVARLLDRVDASLGATRF